jgi:LPS sulfotransferase NodH
MNAPNLRWETQPGGGEFAYSGQAIIGLVTPLAADTSTWVYQVDGVAVRWITKPSGRVKGKVSAKRAVERAWSAWLEHAGLGNAA